MTNGNFKMDDEEVDVQKVKKKKPTKTKVSRTKTKSTIVENKSDDILSFNLLV